MNLTRLVSSGALLVTSLALSMCSKPVELGIGTVGNTMRYDQSALTVPSGATVHLVLHNRATDPTMSHNWVLVQPGTEAEVVAEGLKAGESAGFLPMLADVLAHTPQVKPGSSAEVTFTAPAAGVYPFLCTNPGHAQTMKGALTVTR